MPLLSCATVKDSRTTRIVRQLHSPEDPSTRLVRLHQGYNASASTDAISKSLLPGYALVPNALP